MVLCDYCSITKPTAIVFCAADRIADCDRHIKTVNDKRDHSYCTAMALCSDCLADAFRLLAAATPFEVSAMRIRELEARVKELELDLSSANDALQYPED